MFLIVGALLILVVGYMVMKSYTTIFDTSSFLGAPIYRTGIVELMISCREFLRMINKLQILGKRK